MRLEVDQQASAVECRVITVHSDIGRQARHRRILQDDFRQRLLPLAHGGEGHRLRRFGNALNHSGVLHREKAFRHDHVQEHRQAQGGNGHQQGQRLMLEHPAQLAAVGGNHPINPGPAGAIKTALFLCLGLTLEQPGAHHRREGQGHHEGNQDRHRQGDRELTEQPTDHISHEQQWNQHGNQRNRQ